MFSICSSKTAPTEPAAKTVADSAEQELKRSLDRQNSTYAHEVRTQADGTVPAEKALAKLKEGNMRYVEGKPMDRKFDASARAALAEFGQNPVATIVGCADSRCPVEILFDVQPGDIFVLRNAGNTCTHAEGSLVGSVEYSVGHLHTSLVLVLGHTKCGAIVGATSTALSKKEKAQSGETPPASTLDKLLAGLGPVALQAASELPKGATVDEVAAHAIKVNVFHTMEKLLTYSKPLREKVSLGEVVVQGAIYDIVSGKVEFLGECPRQALVLDMETALLPRTVPEAGPVESIAKEQDAEPSSSAASAAKAAGA
eukprot:TRINITY_DN1938_c0_g1_i4.p1 TRINITY_DN1938_c0_g1~~TRINITY_DN1938_c0_g1_i4.p1  ORF type:complete len:313 (+),score=79.62 TRINITY_DN1938_c0_g1_i4:153-1091(+)